MKKETLIENAKSLLFVGVLYAVLYFGLKYLPYYTLSAVITTAIVFKIGNWSK